MANRQYVGARYVPKFYQGSNGNEWDSGVVYEALTMVTYLGSTYCSKKPVPARTIAPNLDTEYWVLTAAYSSQVAELREELEDTIDRVDGIEDDLEETNDRIDDIVENKTEILLFGDSWADYEHDQSNVRIPQVLSAQFGCNVHNYAYGGTGFDVPNGYDEQITWFEDDTSFDHTKIKYIILVCGLNEYHAGTTSAQFIVKINDWISKIRTAVNDDSIPIYWFSNYSIENNVTTRPLHTTYYHQRNYYLNVLRGIIGNIKGCTTFGWVGASNWNTTNYFHPLEEGSVEYAMNMCSVIRGLPPRIRQYDGQTGTLTSSSVADGLKTVPTRLFLIGDELYAEINPTTASLAHCTTGDTVTYSRNLPGIIDAGNSNIGEGALLTDITVSGYKYTVANSSSNLWGSLASGRTKFITRLVTE